MDDTKTIDESTYTVAIAGTDYTFGLPDPELIERMILVTHMNADEMVIMEACTKWLSAAAGRKTWSVIMRRLMAGEVTAQHIMDAMKDLMTQWTTPKPEDSPADAA